MFDLDELDRLDAALRRDGDERIVAMPTPRTSKVAPSPQSRCPHLMALESHAQ
ncbi:MAG: hypothetical protein AAF409_05505 [Pseudomonadota bacterium]